MSQDRTPQCSRMSAVPSLRLDRPKLPTSPTLAGDPPAAQSSPAAGPTPRGKPRTGAGRARAHRAYGRGMTYLPGPCQGALAARTELTAGVSRVRPSSVAGPQPSPPRFPGPGPSWTGRRHDDGRRPGAVGRGIGHRRVLLSVRAGWTASSGWDRFWLAIAASTWARPMSAGRSAGCRPSLASQQAGSAGRRSGNLGCWWESPSRRSISGGIGTARAKVVRHLRRQECHHSGAGDGCGSGGHAEHAEPEAPQRAWHVGGGAAGNSSSVTTCPHKGTTGAEAGRSVTARALADRYDRRPVDHLVLARERRAAN